ncbi:MAG: septal ring lytic transglycosylase RlpA family protein [Solirubrobacteraceae bacterium]
MMLAVPASAFALSGTVTDTQASAGLPLHVRISPRRTTLNHTVTVSGQAPAVDAGHRAVLETASRSQTDWRPVAGSRIGSTGRFRIRSRLRNSGYLRVIDAGPNAVAAAVTSNRTAPATGGATSAPQRVVVAASFRVASHSRDVLAGSALLVHGWLRPARAGRAVHIQGHSGSGWRTLASGRTGAAGGFRVRLRPTSGLHRRLRVRFAGDTANSGATSSVGAVTVYGQSVASWYNDAGNTACGFHAGFGVANRSLPCGTKVRIRYGGRSVTATVDDRGPFVGGRDWDLNQNTAGALGFGGVGTIWVSQ